MADAATSTPKPPTPTPTIPQGSSSVIVKNIVPATSPPTHKVLTDFFSFCGNIAALSITPEDNSGFVSAVVTFETEGAAKTAVLLNNALIHNKPITVEIAPVGFVPPTSSVGADQLPQAKQQAPRTEESVVQSLMDSGYKLGSDALTTAQQWDAQTGISQSISSGFAVVASKVSELDQTFEISTKAKAVGDTIAAKTAEINQEYQIGAKAAEVSGQAGKFLSETASSIATGAAAATNTVTTFVTTSPEINQGVQTLQNVGSAIGNSITSTFSSLFSAAPAATPPKQ
jgi:hypothetical protein